jgi:hypothetical protein
MQSVFMNRAVPVCWALMPQAIERLSTFLDQYDRETKKLPFLEQIMRMFAAGDVRLGLWVLIDGSKVIGHLLAQPEPLSLETGPWEYVLIHQAEADAGIEVRQHTKQIFAEMEQWSLRLGVNRLYMMTHRDEAMARRWGFRVHKTMMVRYLNDQDVRSMSSRETKD